MDRDDRRRYFVVGSVILKIVTPLFRQRVENDYRSKGIGSLQGYLNTQPVIHILFHLRHKNTRCCKANVNCNNRSSLPLNYIQWDLLYTEKPRMNKHYCHCKYTANPVQTDDLGITLASLILLNCCTLGSGDENAIRELRKFKNNYLSHNSKGRNTELEYNSLWTDLITSILQLDNSKQDDLIRIDKRPLDEPLCEEYIRQLLDFYQKLEEMNVTIQENNSLIKVTNDDVKEVKELLRKLTTQDSKDNSRGQRSRPYKLGQTIFYLHQQTNLSTLISDKKIKVSDGVMMDDGRLVLCLPKSARILIYNTDTTELDSIQLQGAPWCITAVDISTVAIVYGNDSIEMYNIQNKHKLKSISVPGLWLGGITTMNNKLVVSGKRCLYIINHQTGEKIQTIYTGSCKPMYLHTSTDRIFYGDEGYDDNDILHCYNYLKDKFTATIIPPKNYKITSLQDGSLYVVCYDQIVRHVSYDCKHGKPVTTEGLNSLKWNSVISYNSEQRKLFTCTETGIVIISIEKSNLIFKKIDLIIV